MDIPTLTHRLDPACRRGCAGRCNQGRLGCNGKPRPMPLITRAVVRHRSATGVALALACGVIAAISAAALLATLFPAA